MQTRGTFPELNDGRSKRGKKPAASSGMAGFAIKGRAPRPIKAPSGFGARRAASHKKAYGC